MPDAEVDYSTEIRAEWNALAADTANVELAPDERAPTTIIVTGACPRCTHPTAHVDPIVAVRGLDNGEDDDAGAVLRQALRRAGAGVTARDVLVTCGCTTAHPGAPEGTPGCGAVWSLHVSWGG